eukprot:Tamp_13172.p1 GENE.Tamp_13172~~Tamp_13172.p1  ORF type:complete len:390 (+),score=114.23 Tamp_13172:56-1171(+)
MGVGGKSVDSASSGAMPPKVVYNQHDLTAKRNEWHVTPPGPLNALMKSLIKEERDLPIAYLLLNVMCMTLPAAAAVFYVGSNWLGLAYMLSNILLFQERFTLALHFSSHRRLTDNKWLNAIPTYVLSPFFGIPSGMYFLHHVVMHHVENNVFPWDVSSTEPYQRDNFLHFLHYWARFLFAIWVELPYYAWVRGRRDMAISSSCCIVLCLGAYYALYQWNPVGTFWVFVLPTLLGSFFLMFGNWSQHIFVDPRNPEDNYHLTYNVINTPNNQTSFNDGYHIEHHLQSRRHWTELPEAFNEKLDVYAKEEALVFDGLDFMAVGFLTFTGNYKVLTSKLVQFKEPKMSPSEAEAMLRARLVPIHRVDGKQVKAA